jgi:NAD(P)-dependent dehydrogenase (short-subunit alcohol dehydrogenase family)
MSERRRIALVSGSTKGIGKAVAQQLVLDGYIVVQNSRSKILKNQIVGQAHIVADVTSAKACRDLVGEILEKYGNLDLLVCSVGSGSAPVGDTSISNAWDHFLTINLCSTVFLVECAL